MSDTTGFYATVAALQAGVLLTVLAVLVAAAQTVGERLGISTRQLGGRALLPFVLVTFLTFLASGLLGAASTNVSLDRFAGLPLPLALWSQRPEAAFAVVFGASLSLILSGSIALSAGGKLKPFDVARDLILTTTAREMLDSLSAELPEPRSPEGPLLSLQAHSAGVPEEELVERYEDELAAYERVASRVRSRGTLSSPLDPAVRALAILIDQRSALAVLSAWRELVKRICVFLDGDPTSVSDNWPSRDVRDGLLHKWLWATAEDLVRSAYGAHFDRAASLIIRELADPYVRAIQRDSESSTQAQRRMSAIAHVAIEQGDSEGFSAIVEVYESAAIRGLDDSVGVAFGQTVLGLGHLAEITASHDTPPEVIISRNLPDEFQGPFDPSRQVAGALMQVAYEMERRSLMIGTWSLLKDAIYVGFKASLRLSGEATVTYVRTMSDLAVAYANAASKDASPGAKSPNGMDAADRHENLLHELASFANDLGRQPGTDHTEQAWEALESCIIKVGLTHLRAADSDNERLTKAYNVLLSELAPLLPDTVLDDIPRSAYRGHLEFGMERLTRLRSDLGHALGRELPQSFS